MEIDWKKPYNVLRDLFPQVDARIIKATVLDHGDDLLPAIDFIVEEVLGSSAGDFSSKEDGLSSPVCPNSRMEEPRPEEALLEDPALEKKTSQKLWPDKVNEAVYGTREGFSSSPCHLIPNILDNPYTSSCSEKVIESISEAQSPPEVLFSDNTNLHTLGSLQALEMDSSRLGPLACNHESISVMEACVNIRKEGSTLYGDPLESRDLLEKFIEAGSLSEQVKGLESAFTLAGDSLQCTNEALWLTEFQTNQVGEQSCTVQEAEEEICGDIPEHHERFLLGCIGDHIMANHSISELEIKETKSSAWEDSSCNFTHATDSETLDDFVQQIKVEKQQLTDVIEEIHSLHQKADISEASARKSKYEAARAGKIMIAKADEMKHMLAQAREDNAMHAGEVYGEKAVLATEARELLARLVQIREEKTKAVSILSDIRETLHARIEFANLEIEAAEDQLLLKETAAKNALAVEEEFMAKVAQESRNLEIEDEVCRKFREFLIDRGTMVDSLQAEMAILCEDVEALKKGMLSVSLVNSSQVDIESSLSTVGNWEFEDTRVSFSPLNLLDGQNFINPSVQAQEKLKESISVYDNGKSDSSRSSHAALDLSYSAESLIVPAEGPEYGQIDFPSTVFRRFQQKDGITSASSILSCDNMRREMEIGDSYTRWSKKEKESEHLDLLKPENGRVGSFRESSPEEDGWNLVFPS